MTGYIFRYVPPSRRWRLRWRRAICAIFGHYVIPVRERMRGNPGVIVDINRCYRCETVLSVEPLGV